MCDNSVGDDHILLKCLLILYSSLVQGPSVVHVMLADSVIIFALLQ